MDVDVTITPSFEPKEEYDDAAFTDASNNTVSAIYAMVSAGASSEDIESILTDALREAS